jgi:hypothetical protein
VQAIIITAVACHSLPESTPQEINNGQAPDVAFAAAARKGQWPSRENLAM